VKRKLAAGVMRPLVLLLFLVLAVSKAHGWDHLEMEDSGKVIVTTNQEEAPTNNCMTPLAKLATGGYSAYGEDGEGDGISQMLMERKRSRPETRNPSRQRPGRSWKRNQMLPLVRLKKRDHRDNQEDYMWRSALADPEQDEALGSQAKKRSILKVMRL
jgi:hypothetical protein